jgi:hypothetical protein
VTDWREELAEKIAERINEMRLFQSTNTETARAALAVAEPVIREECAALAERMGVVADGYNVAEAIREGGKDD